MESRTVGVLGAGQLGRMFVEAASRLNVKVVLLDVGDAAPAKQINYLPDQQHIDGAFSDPAKILELAAKVDVLTIEIEHVDAKPLQQALDQKIVQAVHPLPATIAMIQDKYEQKRHLVQHKIPVADFLPIEGSDAELRSSVKAAAQQFGYPVMLKSRTQAYDGKGNHVLRSEEGIEKAIEALGGGKRKLYAERWAPFQQEVAVMVVRSASGIVQSYPAVETVHKENICHTVYAPLRHKTDPSVPERARRIAENAVATFGGAGVFGVEMFLMPDGELLLNEIAPRPHNSGHYTIEACETSQYENHLRAILDLPLGSTALKVQSSVMLNLLGLGDLDKDPQALAKTYLPATVSLQVPGTTVHLYGKSGCRKGRKMGHITVVGASDAEVADRLRPLQAALDYATERADSAQPLEDAATLAKRFTYSSSSAAAVPKSAADFTHPHPQVGIIMGSDSDLPVMLPAAEILKKFGVPFELSIVSAHRTPDRMRDYARTAPSRGLSVIIAGAGGAAHLPGMVAAQTALPVIGVPVKGSTLDGIDSLHSIVQMPRGIPVASVAINNSTNAALLAIRILGASNPAYLIAMQDYMDAMEQEVMGKVDKLAKTGWDYSNK